MPSAPKRSSHDPGSSAAGSVTGAAVASADDGAHPRIGPATPQDARPADAAARVARYWLHTFKRLLPLATLTILLTLAALWAFFPTTQIAQFRSQGVASVMYVENWALAAEQVDYYAAGWIALWPLLSAAAIIVAGQSGSRIGFDRFLSWGPIVRLGDAAYALYLVHWPLLITYLVLRDRPDAGALAGTALVLASIALALLLTRWFEEPLKRWS